MGPPVSQPASNWPSLLQEGPIAYPPDALAARGGGFVAVRVDIAPDGAVLAAWEHPTSDGAKQPALIAAAVDAARQARFRPLASGFRNFLFAIEFDPASGSVRWRVPPPPPPPPPTSSGSPQAGALATGRTAYAAAPTTAPRPLVQLDEAKVVEFSARINANPDDVSYYWALAKVYEDAGQYERAAELHEQAVTRRPNDPAALLQQAGFYNRQGDFPRTIEALTRQAAVNPDDPVPYYTLATYYWDKAFRDPSLSDASKREHIAAGLKYVDRALSLKPDFADAMVYKGLLLRTEAQLEQDPARRQALVDEANRLRDAAMQLKKGSGGGRGRETFRRTAPDDDGIGSGGRRAPGARAEPRGLPELGRDSPVARPGAVGQGRPTRSHPPTRGRARAQAESRPGVPPASPRPPSHSDDRKQPHRVHGQPHQQHHVEHQ